MAEGKGLSRRDFLKSLGVAGAGTAMVAAGVPFVAASGAAANARAQAAEVTLLIAGWPYPPLPAETPEGGYDAYQQALAQWLDENPNVRMESVEVGIWDTSALLTAIAGGTAPAYFSTGVIGNWNVAGMQAAYLQGLVANISEQFDAFGIGDKLSSIAIAGRPFYAIGDDEYGVINELAPGNGIFFRRDWLAEAGLPEPTTDWTWDDVREIAAALTTDSRKGIAMQSWGLGSWVLGSEGLGDDSLLAATPHRKLAGTGAGITSRAAEYEAAVGRYRAMMFEDQSVLSDVSSSDGSIAPQFLNQEVAMMTNPSQFYTRTSDPWLHAGAAARQTDGRNRRVHEPPAWHERTHQPCLARDHSGDRDEPRPADGREECRCEPVQLHAFGRWVRPSAAAGVRGFRRPEARIRRIPLPAREGHN